MALVSLAPGGWPRLAALLGLSLALTGCAGTDRLRLRTSLRTPDSTDAPPRHLPAEPAYTISCPDVVEIVVAGRSDCNGRFVISPEGRINLGALGEPRVEGETEQGLAKRI